MPKKCVGCDVAKGKNKYSTAQWKKASGACICIECAVKLKEEAAAEAQAGQDESTTKHEDKKEELKTQPLLVCATCNKTQKPALIKNTRTKTEVFIYVAIVC